MKAYVFSTKKDADEAIAEVNQKLGYPVTSVNLKTGKPEPEKQKTVEWSKVKESKTGRYFFSKVPDKKGVTLSKPCTIEDYDRSWQDDGEGEQ